MNTISLSFSSDSLRLIELNEDKEIVYIDELDLDINLDDDILNFKDSEIVISELAEKVETILSGKNENSKAGVLIETSQTFLLTVPIEVSEDKAAVNSQILWEISNYYPETYKDFNIKYYRLNNMHVNENIDEVLIIAVDKNKIEFIKNVCRESNLDIKIIDIDHFAVEKCIKEIYKDEADGNTLIIGCKKNRVDFSLIIGGKLKFYDFTLINERNSVSAVAKELKFLYSYFSDTNINNVFIYGGENSKQVKKFFDESKKFSPVFLNPFLNFNFKEEINLEENSLSKFAPVYGLALKSFGGQ